MTVAHCCRPLPGRSDDRGRLPAPLGAATGNSRGQRSGGSQRTLADNVGKWGSLVGVGRPAFPYMHPCPELWGPPFVGRLTAESAVTSLSARWIVTDPRRSAKSERPASENRWIGERAICFPDPRRTVWDTGASSDDPRSNTTFAALCVHAPASSSREATRNQRLTGAVHPSRPRGQSPACALP